MSKSSEVCFFIFIMLTFTTYTIAKYRQPKWISARPFRNFAFAHRGGSTSQNLSHRRWTNNQVVVPRDPIQFKENVNLVRDIMSRESIDALIVPTDDPHLNEYIAPHFARREFISGFTGSAGVAVITKEKALLFTDGRYHRQAEMELSSDWTLMKVGLSDIPNHTDYLLQTMTSGTSVGIDPLVHSSSSVQALKDSLGCKEISLKFLRSNPIDEVWHNYQTVQCNMARPTLPNSNVRIHPLQYAGKSVGQKLEEIRKLMLDKNDKCDVLVLTALDEIMWLLNIRGSDVPCNPISYCYCIVRKEDVLLFIDERKVDKVVQEYFTENHVLVRPYDELLTFLQQQLTNQANTKIWIDTKTANAAISESIPAKMKFEKRSPIVMMKAIKNDAELNGMRECHLRDGAAFAEFLSWLEEQLAAGREISEYDIDIHLTQSRAQCIKFLEPSFATIAGVNENGAIIHYRANQTGCKMLSKNDMLLLDSGGQYIDGTTDVTRTFHFGQPTPVQREMYTRVLKGHIGIDRQVFPVGTPGCFLDIYAREHLWQVGKNFIHGTGHGVGAALNVHEGPQRISPLVDGQGLFAGMIVSNEPGYYVENSFGIRIENLLIVVPRNDLGMFAGKGFLGFERLTQIPIQTKLLDVNLLTDLELNWLNAYHEEVKCKIKPLLKTERACKWLDAATCIITR